MILDPTRFCTTKEQEVRLMNSDLSPFTADMYRNQRTGELYLFGNKHAFASYEAMPFGYEPVWSIGQLLFLWTYLGEDKAVIKPSCKEMMEDLVSRISKAAYESELPSCFLAED